MLYAGDRKGEIKLWKVGPGADQHTCKGTLAGHKGAIWMLQYDEEIGRLYSCCDDKKVIAWDVAQLKQVRHRHSLPLINHYYHKRVIAWVIVCVKQVRHTHHHYTCRSSPLIAAHDHQWQVKAFDGHKDKVYREALFLEGRETPEGGIRTQTYLLTYLLAIPDRPWAGVTDVSLTILGRRALRGRLHRDRLPMGHRPSRTLSQLEGARGLGVGHAHVDLRSDLGRSGRHGQAVGPAHAGPHPPPLPAQPER